MSDPTPVVGANILIKANTGTISSPTFVSLGGQRGATLRRSASTIDTSCKTNNGWKTSNVGLKEWGIDADGIIVVSNDGYDKIKQCFDARETVQVAIDIPETSERYYGLAVIVDFPIDAPYDQAATYKLKLEGASELYEGTPS